jgi:hypothetical protein
MRAALIAAITIGMLAAPAAAQGKGDRSAGKGRVETQAQCEARQQRIRDPVSGVRIQAGDAGRFCNRQRSRR